MNATKTSILTLLSAFAVASCSGSEAATPANTGTGATTTAGGGAGNMATATGGTTTNTTGTDTTTAGTTTTGTDTTAGGGAGTTATTGSGGAATTGTTINTTAGGGGGATTSMGNAGSGTTSMGGGGAGTMGGGGSGATMMGAGGSGSEVTPTTCSINIMTSEVSETKSTVGIVEFSTDLAGLASAEIHFGLEAGAYTITAPVDLEEPNYRTLLLGMKPSSDYHYQIVVSNGNEQCSSDDNTITTGPRANGLPQINISTNNAEALYGGYFITGQYAGANGQYPAYILDADGDFVWWHMFNTDVTSVRMSYDNKYMWLMRANVPSGQANVHRVAIDGSSDENLSDAFDGANHQMTVLPDETVAFFAYGGSCDDVKEYNPATGMVRTLINAEDAHGAGGPCHLNAIQYSHEDDTLIFSDLDNNNYTKITRDSPAEVVWVLGGSTSDFSGAGSQWERQHGLDVLGLDRLLIFNNGGLGGGGGSLALEILLDLNGMSATIPWQYGASPGINNVVMGDVQRLPNGNTLVSYSTQGVVHEVDMGGNLLQELEFASGGQFGYVIKRESLYGPPPK